MNTKIIIIISIIYACTSLAGCATQTPAGTGPGPAAELLIPALDPTQVHYIARVPRDQAQTAAVARALTHIALGNAREITGKELCGGTLLLNGKVTGRVEPTPVRSPSSSGGHPVWYYRISHAPGFHGCANRPSDQLYRKMQANLPAWIAITPATEKKLAREAVKETLTLLE